MVCLRLLLAAAAVVQATAFQKGPEDDLAQEMTHDLEMNFNKIAPSDVLRLRQACLIHTQGGFRTTAILLRYNIFLYCK